MAPSEGAEWWCETPEPRRGRHADAYSLFAAVFTPAQTQHLVTVLLGLVLAPERRTLSGLRGRLAGAGSLSALSRFVSGAPWQAAALAEAWQARFRAQLAPRIQAEHARQRAERPRRRGRPAATRVTAFAIFDDSTIAKHAQGETEARMEGVGRHYSTTAKARLPATTLST